MDRSTYKLAQTITKREKLAADLAAVDRQLATDLARWSDSRPDAVGGGTATLAGASFLLRQSGILPAKRHGLTKPNG